MLNPFCFVLCSDVAGGRGISAAEAFLPVYKQEAGVVGEELVKRKRFNRLWSSGQVVVESTLGTLKSRFPYVYDEMQQKKLGNAAKTILAACTLHNF